MKKAKQQANRKIKINGRMCSKRDIEEIYAMHQQREPCEPDEDDCCYGNCRVCVFDDYVVDLQRFQEGKKQLEGLLLEFEEN